ncbi:MAG: TonB-dependent receptor [Bryobacterales bacterium]|nr:TonB-dependent receptor [Bryobacterales bacterium]
MRSVVFLFSVLTMYAQSNGRIAGLILDPANAAVPHAELALEQAATGWKRLVQTDGLGRYSIPDIPIGSYRITAKAPGFTTTALEDVSVTVAASISLDIRLQLAGSAERIEVGAEIAAVSAHQTSGVLVDARPLLELPVNGRDYARFSLLAPGAVARSSSLSDLSFNGLHPAHNNFTIDGVDASRGDQPTMADGFSRGARLLTGSIDTMAEFRVQSSNYRAEYGRAAGSVITIATRSGGNNFHGGLFEFFRNSSLDARNYFNTANQPKDAFRYNNFGGNLGGRIWRDRTFFFVNGELSRQRQGVRGTGTVPSAAMREQALRTSSALGFLLENFPAGQSPTANPLVDNYTRFQSLAIDENTASARLDHTFSGRDRMFARLNMNNSLVDGPLFSILPTALGVTDFQFVPSKSRNAALNYQRTVSNRTLMELTAGMQRTMTEGSSETPYPQVSITGVTVFPGSRRLNLSNSTVFQYSGTWTHVRGGHTWKAGASAWRARVNSWTTAFTSLVYTSLADFIANRMQQATLTAGTFGNGIRQTHTGLFVQDTWQMRPGLTVDLGMRYDFTTPNHDGQNRLRPFDTRTMALAPAGDAWYRWDRNNFAPRAGIAWQVRRRLAVRTGYGLFYQQYAPGGGNAVAQNTLAGNAVLTRQAVPILSWPLEAFLSQGVAPAPVANGFHFDKPDVYAQQWNFTLVQELWGDFGLETAYVGNRGINLRRQYNLNWIDPLTGRRPLPQLSRVNVEYANGQSTYHGFQAALRRRLGASAQTTFNYTFGKAIDNVPDAAVGSAEPQDFRCLPCERGLGATDIRHNVTFGALWELPWKRSRLAGGWKLAVLGIARSGAALNVTQPQNTVGSDNVTNQRPDSVARASPYVENPSPERWLNPAAFSAAPRGRLGTAGRNPISGPEFVQLDGSVMKDNRIGERMNMQLRAEFFNLLNRPNFAPPNTVVGTPNFGRIFNTYGRTIGAGTSRQIQFGLRFGW